MAAVLIQTHYITSGLGGGGIYMTGQYIRVIGDGSAIVAELWTAGTGGTYIATPSGGPDLFSDGITVSSGSFNDPQECIGSDLQYYTVKNEWPYADYHLAIDSPTCTVTVCDLTITGYTTTNESTVGSSNGEVALTATSSNGTIEFSLTPDFVYGTGQPSPITGLPSANYIVYAKDAAGCTDQVNVFIGIDFTYGVKWRMEYDHVKPKGYVTRVDIEQRDYAGEPIWCKGGADPFILEKNYNAGNQLVPSEATVQLFVSRGEEGKFNDIRLGDDKQHVVRKYIDRGAGWELEWLGYVSPEFYEEPYIHEPYWISIKAIDGLGELKNKAFVMDSGEEYFGDMRVIRIIAECLKKLPIGINIHSCVNIYEDRMDRADDPLNQAVIKAENFRGKNCEEVINSLIKPFAGAELFQSLGTWWIRTKEQAVDTTLDYRIFDADGIYYGNTGAINARKNLGFPSTTTRLCWADRSALLKYTRPYGKVTIIHDLDKDNNMIDEGGFELEDIDPSTEFFRGWNLFPTQTSISSGLEYVDNGDSKSAFFFRWQGGGSNQSLNELRYKDLPISIGPDYGNGNPADNAATSFKLRFQTYLLPIYKVDWIWVGWRLRFKDANSANFWDWQPTSGGPLSTVPTMNIEHINDLYVTSFNTVNTHEFLNFRFPGPPSVEDYVVQFSLFFHNHKHRDFITFDQLRAVVTETGSEPSMAGKRYYVGIQEVDTPEVTHAYELQRNTEDESEPNIIRPDDYFEGDDILVSNPYQWIRTNSFNIERDDPLLDKIIIDNVSISMFSITVVPGIIGVVLIDPPETATYSETITTRNQSSLTEPVLNGDAPPIVGANYIYNGFFTLLDGTPTKYWGRTSVTGAIEPGELIDDGDFDTGTPWEQEGAGTPWNIVGGEANAVIATGASNKLVQFFDNGAPGDYVLAYEVTVGSITVPTDSLNLGFTFRDEDDNVVHTQGDAITADGTYWIGLDWPFTTAEAVTKIEIEAVVNSGAGIEVGIQSVSLVGPRVGVERQPLLNIYLAYLTAQGAKSKRILSGTAIADIQIGYINSLVDQIDNRKYRFLRFALNDKHGNYDFEAEETLVGADGESPPAVGAYSPGYSEAYDI